LNKQRTNKITYLGIIKYFYNNYLFIDNIKKVKKYFGSKITDTTEEQKKQLSDYPLLFNKFIGQKHYNFSFKTPDYFLGSLDVDFINKQLRNIRCQLFAEGFFANNFGLKNQKKYIHDFFSNKLGQTKEMNPKMPFTNTLSWIDNENNLFISLSDNKKQKEVRRYISLGIELNSRNASY